MREAISDLALGQSVWFVFMATAPSSDQQCFIMFGSSAYIAAAFSIIGLLAIWRPTQLFAAHRKKGLSFCQESKASHNRPRAELTPCCDWP